MKPALVILAAGMGTRFGKGIKQLEPVGPKGELIVDYSIHDALEAGFGKVVFIIRKSMEQDFRERIGKRIEKQAETVYVFQELEDLPEGFLLPKGRTKPWGTGHALLCCREVIHEPFAVINADDYYGKEAFRKMAAFLTAEKLRTQDGVLHGCMAGFVLKNTLSDSGTVTRGICRVTEEGLLRQVIETYEIRKEMGSIAQGVQKGEPVILNQQSLVSMNMWGFSEDFLGILEKGFSEFLSSAKLDPLKSEYLLPDIVDREIRNGRCTVMVLKTEDRWFGMTYQEDVPAVKEAIRRLIDEGQYPEKLVQETGR
ncbi:nucleotidyltransferase [Clostridium sp. M62/1]|uniref:nucleotidyltransferase family protein n=1 Tax=Clostridium sp. M62/1 TaxID=411486 RepID=UPI0001973745|nr:sugar phosphate nucleotidyltransferase [Clostridium sp. M62/1]EFE14052.1 hypothetical protein CLOM621_05628 [Clostridium sp. M62/1]UEB80289.1 nucleotidyltransferase [Clostridium sp. M62/1]